jgi:hypothetical protein
LEGGDNMNCICCGELIKDESEIGFYESIKPLKPVCFDCSESGDYFDSSLNTDLFDPNCDFDLGAY